MSFIDDIKKMVGAFMIFGGSSYAYTMHRTLSLMEQNLKNSDLTIQQTWYEYTMWTGVSIGIVILGLALIISASISDLKESLLK